jgi:hypothetical protein
MPSTPFIDTENGGIDVDQIAREAVPIAYIIGLFVSVALIPFLVVLLFGGRSLLGALLVFVSQFVLAVGAAVTLLYVVARGIELADA